MPVKYRSESDRGSGYGRMMNRMHVQKFFNRKSYYILLKFIKFPLTWS